MNDVIQLYKSGKKDSWGIATKATEPTSLKGMVIYATTLEEMKTVEGTTINITATVVFKGMVDININDDVGINVSTNAEKKLKVNGITLVRDLSGKVIFTKVVL